MTIFAAPTGDLVSIYDQMAPSYDAAHDRWLRYAGGEAQAALEAVVRVSMTPQARLLDAGCGTGAFARRLLAEGHAAENLTLLDPSEAMLRRCGDMPCERVRGRLEDIPFQDEAFDIVLCAWALETVGQRRRAICEMCRVLRPGGLLCLAFCAQKPPRGPLCWIVSRALSLRGRGRFLPVEGVRSLIEAQDGFQTRVVPLAGPAAVVVARKAAPRSPGPSY